MAVANRLSRLSTLITTSVQAPVRTDCTDMATNNLERLPPELQTAILLYLPSTESLYNLIRASPRFHKVFNISKEVVLSQMVYTVVGLEALPDALAAVTGPRGTPRGLGLTYLEKIIDIQTGYRVSIDKMECLPISTSLDLLRLEKSIKYHMARFTRYAQSNLSTCSQSVRPNNQLAVVCVRRDPLARTEEVRIRRAFYRVDLYCYLFHSSDRRSNNERHHVQIPTKHQEAVFLAKIPPWEVEEMACVWHYLRHELEKAFDDVEDYFVDNAFRGTPLEAAAAVATLKNDRKEVDWEIYSSHKFYDKPGTIPGHMDKLFPEGAYDFFRSISKRVTHDRHIEYLASMGLAFLRSLFEAKIEQQKETILNINPRQIPKFLTSALSVYGTKATERYDAWDTGWYDEDGDENCEAPNEGFKWAMAFSPTYPCRHRGGIRSLGLVFWDTRRLLGILGPKRDVSYVPVVCC